MSCNPYGSNLQFTCLAIGPLNSSLKVTWYTYNANESQTPQRINGANYRVNEKRLLAKEDHISSMLELGFVSEEEENVCIWCQIETNWSYIPVASNKLCIAESESYSNLPNCASPYQVLNTTRLCIELTSKSIFPPSTTNLEFSTFLASSLVSKKSVSVPISSVFVTYNPIVTHQPTAGTALSHLAPTQTTSATVALSNTPLATRGHLYPSPTMENLTNQTALGPGNTNHTQLYAAVATCVLLAAVIMLLLITVLTLCRKRGWRHSILHSPKSFKNMSRFSSSGKESNNDCSNGLITLYNFCTIFISIA